MWVCWVYFLFIWRNEFNKFMFLEMLLLKLRVDILLSCVRVINGCELVWKCCYVVLSNLVLVVLSCRIVLLFVRKDGILFGVVGVFLGLCCFFFIYLFLKILLCWKILDWLIFLFCVSSYVVWGMIVYVMICKWEMIDRVWSYFLILLFWKFRNIIRLKVNVKRFVFYCVVRIR